MPWNAVATAGSGILNFIGNMIGIRSAERQADKNYSMQREQFNYQKGLNQMAMDREDNAMQRRVQDMRAAGLNPVLAAGGQGAGSAHMTSAEAPQRKMDYYMYQSMLANLGQQIADVTRTQAESDRIRAEIGFRDRELDQRDKSIAVDRSRVALEADRVGIEGARQNSYAQDVLSNVSYRNVLNSLHQAQIGMINEQQLTEQLRREGVRTENAQKVMDYYQEAVTLYRNFATRSGNLSQSHMDQLRTLFRDIIFNASGQTHHQMEDEFFYRWLNDMSRYERERR